MERELGLVSISPKVDYVKYIFWERKSTKFMERELGLVTMLQTLSKDYKVVPDELLEHGLPKKLLCFI